MRKFLSRKFLLPILYGLFVVGNTKYNIGLNDTELISIAGAVSSFVIGESYIDAQHK